MAVSKERKSYLGTVEEFLALNEPVVVKPIRIRGGDISGWEASRGCVSLPSSRGGPRIFKSLAAVAPWCVKHGIDGFDVRGI